MTHEVERRKKVEKIFIIQLYDGRIKRISVAGYFSQSQLAMRFFKDQTNINASNITHHIILCTLHITSQNYKFLVIALNVMWSKAYQWVVNFILSDHYYFAKTRKSMITLTIENVLIFFVLYNQLILHYFNAGRQFPIIKICFLGIIFNQICIW